MANPVIIVDYDANWPRMFEQLRAPVAAALGNVAASIEHIGSTSVPGLAAKPIIDIEVIVATRNVAAAIEKLATIGYVHQGDRGVRGREAFQTPPQTPYYHHLYVCAAGSDEHCRQIAFRDFLRVHPQDAATYAALKKRLAKEYQDNRDGYTEAKTEFIHSILAKALR